MNFHVQPPSLGYNLFITLMLSLLLLVESENEYNELPQLFSPRQPERFTGKIVYYEPKNLTESSTQVPWEDVLKETVVLTLQERDDPRKTTYSTKRRIKEIYRAPYKGMINVDSPKFGDIVLLAKGRLERAENETYVFVQSDESCDRRCFEQFTENPNVTALWSVERIRHRDHARGHRFELKFTVVPLNEDKSQGADSGLRISKSFIVRDDDYPKYFVGEGQVTATVSRRSDRRTIFDMFDIMPLMNAFIPYSPRYTPNMRPELNIGEYSPRPLPNRVPLPPAMTVIRLPPKIVRYPEQVKTPFSGKPMSGVHLYLNGLHNPQLPQSYKPSPTPGRPVFDLDKLNDYSKQMEYQGSIDAKKAFPGPKEEETKNVTPITDNTLDWKASEPPKTSAHTGAYTLTTVYEGSQSSKAPQAQAQPPTVTHSPVHPVANFVYSPHPVHHIHPQIPPVMVPHIPAMLVPIQNHLTPFGVPMIVTPSNAGVQADPLSTTTHYGENHHGQVPVPPFTPLHHTMAKIRPLSRLPMTPPQKPHNFRESQKHESSKYSVADPVYTSSSPPSTAPYRNVLPSPYSSPSSRPETSTATQFSRKPVHEHIDEPQEEFVPIGPTPWRDFEATRTKSEVTNKPDSINAQLPPPEKGYEAQEIPYVREKPTKKQVKAKITAIPISPSTSISSETTTRGRGTVYTTPTSSTGSDYSTSKYKSMYKTTDKPVLKWIPKKARTKPTESMEFASTIPKSRTKPTESQNHVTTFSRARQNLDFAPTISSTSRTRQNLDFAPTISSTARTRQNLDFSSTISTTSRTRQNLDFVPTISSSTTIRNFVTRPITTTTTTTPSTTASSSTVGVRPVLRFTKPTLSRSGSIEKVNATTMRPRPFPSLATGSTSTRSTTTTTTTAAATKPSDSSTTTTRNVRGRYRGVTPRRRENSTIDGAESKTSLTHSISVDQRRRKIKKTRTQPTKVASTGATQRITTTPLPFLPTTTNDPPSTTSEIVRAAIHPIETNSSALHLFQASEPASNQNELDASLTQAILQHARALHSPESGYFFNKKQKFFKSYEKN